MARLTITNFADGSTVWLDVNGGVAMCARLWGGLCEVDVEDGANVELRINHEDYLFLRMGFNVVGDTSLPVQQVADRNFTSPDAG